MKRSPDEGLPESGDLAWCGHLPRIPLRCIRATGQ